MKNLIEVFHIPFSSLGVEPVDILFDALVLYDRIKQKCPYGIYCGQNWQQYYIVQVVGVPYGHAEVSDKYTQGNICDEMYLLVHDIHRMISVVRRLYVRGTCPLFKHTEIVIVYAACYGKAPIYFLHISGA